MDVNRDEEHLRMLSIFHYVVAGLGALFSLFPLIYTAMGTFFIFAAHHWPRKPGQEPPPELVGWILIAFGSAFFLVGDRVDDLYFDHGEIDRAPQALLV
jgi:hypothetical protein